MSASALREINKLLTYFSRSRIPTDQFYWDERNWTVNLDLQFKSVLFAVMQ